MFSIQVASYEIIRNYHFFEANLEEMIVGTGTDRHFDSSSVVAELNASFLAAQAPPIVLTAEKNLLSSAMADLAAIVDATPASGAFVSPVPMPASAKGELRSVANLFAAALTAPQSLPDTLEYQIDASLYLATPFTRSSILSATGLLQLWNLTPGDGIEPAPEMGEHILNTFYAGPATPPRTPCVDDATCFNVDPTWLCNSYRGGEQGYCSNNTAIACTFENEFVACGDDYLCSWQFCGHRPAVIIDSDPLEPVFDNRRMPSFITDPEKALDIGEAMGFAFGHVKMIFD